MNNKRTIAVMTGTRAEFGLLKPVMQAINAHPKLNLQVIAGGLHLVQNTLNDITDAGFKIDAQIPMQRDSETGRIADAIAMGMGVVGTGAVLSRLKPDIVLVLGDRIEAMAAASAASIGGFYLAHIHGGDRAEGVADEAMRHAISKLAHLHFAATKQSAKRLVKMGESPEHVFNTGSPAIDGLDDFEAMTDEELIELGFTKPFAILLQHPAGLDDATECKNFKATIKALGKMSYLPILPNRDPGYQGIADAMTELKIDLPEPLPRPLFISMLKRAVVLVGNSSAGIIEAAAVNPKAGGVPVVNIGHRQNGRQKPSNVIDCDYGFKSVSKAIKQAIKNPPQCRKHPYGDGTTGKQIAKLLAKVNFKQLPLGKQNSY